jgi:membrane-bound lytic murein transglycosylase D
MPLLRRFLIGTVLLIQFVLPAAAQPALLLTPSLSTSSVLAPPPEGPFTVLPDSGQTLQLGHDPSQEVQDDLPPIPTIDLTTPPDDLWQRMRNGFAMPDLESPLVVDRQAWYLNRPDFLRRVFARSKPYLFHIVSELEKRGMPTELALLPIVESSYNPLAHSPARALGMWQFIPSTGKNYNLQQNWWLDQRRDIIASTSAALDYLQYIYQMHGDWQLALASYNWGEGAVGRAIAKNQAKGKPTDYMSLTMPNETRFYVPKLQAIKNIVARPELFGITLDRIANTPYFETIELNDDMDVALAARFAEIPVDEFIALNPAYSRPVMLGSANSPVVIPADKMQVFLRNLEKHEQQDKALSSWLSHTLKVGEKIDAVATRYGTNGTRLRLLNGITKRTKIGPGFTLLVPSPQAKLADMNVAGLPQTPAEPPSAAKKNGAKGKAVKPSSAKAGAKPSAKAGTKTSSTKAAAKSTTKAPVRATPKPTPRPAPKARPTAPVKKK